MVLVAGGVPKILETDVNSRFKITPEQLEAAITPKTRLFVINSRPTRLAWPTPSKSWPPWARY